MSICEGILQVMEEQAASQQFKRVKSVWLEIGPLAGVELDALRFGFDVVTRDSLADGARLEIIEMPGTAWCLACSKSVPIRQRFDACPECGSFQLQITGGDELRIKELEVD
ncbi:hydrogenase maturation nickel metallochaperone HypA [Sedimenticola thiotaurini]|uniref:Hydrogenase maturation factor HypA n=1 Tax=Sedimenticola thiotaurini TaxID=1543721 RepID=A0A0F7K2Z8_9GAMM|nr:hydrogenase nickel incorporation protein HypA [Sedimenticola thiotaurini]